MNLVKMLFISLLLLPAEGVRAEQNARGLLKRDLEKSIKVLRNDTRLYNYFYLSRSSDLSTLTSRQITASNKVFSGASQFWNLNDHSTQLSNSGPGLYLALDPYSSSPLASLYSGGNFGESMIELTLKSKTKYFSSIKGTLLSDDTINALINENILSDGQVKSLLRDKKFGQDTLHYIVLPEYYAFRVMVQDIFFQSEVKLIEYIWMTALQLLCGNGYNGSTMLYIGNMSSIDPSIISNTLVHWPGLNRKVEMSLVEIEAFGRNKKLRNVLSKLKELERIYDNSLSSWRRSRALIKANSIISKNYGGTAKELEDIKLKTFGCLK